MAIPYDKYYQTENLFGEPYPELIGFFKDYPNKGKVLDLGCGQGRDALALARLGYGVTGIDHSKVGIEQLNQIAQSENLDLVGKTGDIYAYTEFDEFDIILLDSMFHFEKKDKEKEVGLIHKIISGTKKGGLIAFCVQDTGKKVRVLKDSIDQSGHDFGILNDSSLVYTYEDKESNHKSKIKYCMYIVQKK